MGNEYENFWRVLRGSRAELPADRWRYHHVLKFVSKNVAMGAKVHDVGCSSGELLEKIKQIRPDLQLTGSDVSVEAVAVALQKSVGECFVADYCVGEPRQELLSKFDVVILSEVIEHVERDRALLSAILLLLKPGGVLYLSTQSGKRYRMDREVLGHLRHYEKQDLIMLLKETGFDVVKASKSGFPMLSLQKLLVDILFERVVPSVTSGNRAGAAQRFAMSTFYWLWRLFPLPFGPQLVSLSVRR